MTPDERMAAWDRGIRTLLITGTHKKAANDAGCNIQTWHEWRKDEAFQRLFEIRREQVATVAVEEMGALFLTAREVFAEAMGPEQKIEVRLKAASKVADIIARSTPLDKAAPEIPALAIEVSSTDAAAELRRRKALSPPEPQPLLDADSSEDF